MVPTPPEKLWNFFPFSWAWKVLEIYACSGKFWKIDVEVLVSF